MRRTESVAVAVLIGLVAVACSTTSTPTTQLKDSVGQIAFVSNRDGNFEVYVMDTDGSNQTRLTNNPAIDEGPAWSPDGTKIAFRSDRDGNFEVYVMDTDGSNQTRLTNNPAFDSFPAWSPVG